MQSSTDVFKADQATADRAKVLVRFGFTERQARFMATVMLHSRLFVGRQYAAFAGITHGQKVHDFKASAGDECHVRNSGILELSLADCPSYFDGSTLTVAVGPTPAVRIHIGSFPDPS